MGALYRYLAAGGIALALIIRAYFYGTSRQAKVDAGTYAAATAKAVTAASCAQKQADAAASAGQRTYEIIHDELVRLTGECPARGDCVICAERADDRTQRLCMVEDLI